LELAQGLAVLLEIFHVVGMVVDMPLLGKAVPSTKAGEVYLKLTVIEDVLIVSFKEL
jgi:hypothetical protein